MHQYTYQDSFFKLLIFIFKEDIQLKPLDQNRALNIPYSLRLNVQVAHRFRFHPSWSLSPQPNFHRKIAIERIKSDNDIVTTKRYNRILTLARQPDIFLGRRSEYVSGFSSLNSLIPSIITQDTQLKPSGQNRELIITLFSETQCAGRTPLYVQPHLRMCNPSQIFKKLWNGTIGDFEEPQKRKYHIIILVKIIRLYLEVYENVYEAFTLSISLFPSSNKIVSSNLQAKQGTHHCRIQ